MINDFELLSVIGYGTFGNPKGCKIFLTRMRSTGKVYQLKALSKEWLASKNLFHKVQMDRDVTK